MDKTGPDGFVVSNRSKVLRAATPKADPYALGAVPSWSIGSAGNLQRSFDHGTSWQNVNVDGHVSPDGATGAILVAAMNVPEKDAEKEKYAAAKNEGANPAARDEASKKAATEPIVFRAVSANGADVWAGGAGALLYHSTDAGGHWIRVIPVTASAVLAGEIVGVEFSDPKHGKVSTSTPEVWTTSNGGQTWQKQ